MRYIAVFPTLTQSQKAQRTLSRAIIPCETVKVDSARTRRGCSWGVAFQEAQLYNVKIVLENAGIREREIIREDE